MFILAITETDPLPSSQFQMSLTSTILIYFA